MFNLKKIFFELKRIFYENYIKLGSEVSYRLGIARTAKMKLGDKMLLACVYGGISDFVSKGKQPISIMFRPAVNTKKFTLMECRPSAKNLCLDKKNFKEVKGVKPVKLFSNVYLFKTKNKNKDYKYYVKSPIKSGEITSGIVESKISKGPTKKEKGVINRNNKIFSWPDPKYKGFWISFIAIVDSKGELVSGVYNFSNSWKFPDIKYVPYHYHKPFPSPTLKKGSKYKLIYLAIDKQGWIDYLEEKDFIY